MHWQGILPSLPTPFVADGRVDVDAFCRVARFAAESSVGGLVTFGLAGEVSRLTLAEREMLLEALISEIGAEVPILTGATAENTAESRRLVEHAEGAGAAGVILPPPTAYSLSENEMIDFFVDVASATSLPVIIQDAPEYLSVALRPAAVAEAASRAVNISAVKLETGAEGIELWQAELGSSFGIYGGNGGVFLLDCLRSGADGIMPGVDTVDLQVRIAQAESSGRRDEAEDLFMRLLPMLVFEMQSIEHYNLCAKYVLRRRGIELGSYLRLPGPSRLSDRSTQRLENYLSSLGLISDVPTAAG